ncbi:hypothetical protein DL96DRAFT_1566308 [Flagelloscypha sp. PMI_526]|nr:hypothetical protein DL96DRAFT_1566308 [Flagelloscypha sp. PMI_526]
MWSIPIRLWVGGTWKTAGNIDSRFSLVWLGLCFPVTKPGYSFSPDCPSRLSFPLPHMFIHVMHAKPTAVPALAAGIISPPASVALLTRMMHLAQKLRKKSNPNEMVGTLSKSKVEEEIAEYVEDRRGWIIAQQTRLQIFSSGQFRPT